MKTDDKKSKRLLRAARKGNLDQSKILLKSTPNTQVFATQNNTRLHLAAQGGHYEVCEFLIRYSAHKNTKNKQEKAPYNLIVQVMKSFLESYSSLRILHDLILKSS